MAKEILCSIGVDVDAVAGSAPKTPWQMAA
jgi:hypothetical protein